MGADAGGGGRCPTKQGRQTRASVCARGARAPARSQARRMDAAMSEAMPRGETHRAAPTMRPTAAFSTPTPLTTPSAAGPGHVWGLFVGWGGAGECALTTGAG